MFELLTVILFVWLMIKAIGLAFRLTWGAARIAASILMALAVPVLAHRIVLRGVSYQTSPDKFMLELLSKVEAPTEATK